MKTSMRRAFPIPVGSRPWAVLILPFLLGINFPSNSLSPVEAQALRFGKWTAATNRNSVSNTPQVMFASGDWTIVTCVGTRTVATLEVINDLIDVGVPWVDGGSRVCPTELTKDWMFTRDASTNEFKIDDESYIRLVTSVNDTGYQLLNPASGGDLVAATVRKTTDKLSGGTWNLLTYVGGSAQSRSSGWDILFNARDFNFLPGYPSQTPDHVPDVENFQYDVLMHELMHVLGADHLEVSQPEGPMPASVMYPSAAGAGHFGTEVNADLWAVDAVQGQREVPYNDLLFIDNWYLGIVLPSPSERRVHTWRTLITSSDELEVAPFGDENLVANGWPNEYYDLGPVCDGEVPTGINMAKLPLFLPGLSALDSDSYNPIVIGAREESSLFGAGQFAGQAWMVTDDYGSMWSADSFSPPSSGGVDWVYNYYLHRDYDRLVVLHYTLAGSDLSYISIPFRLTLPADCPCDGSPPTIGCCEVECDTEE